MQELTIVENPRRKKKRSTRKKTTKRKTRRRRRNPTLATYVAGNPKRKRRTSKRRNTYTRSRARRNPRGGGLMSYFNLKSAFSIAGGIATAHYAPNLVAMVWPGVPREGIAGTATKIVSVGLVSYGIGKVIGKDVGLSFAAGGIGYCLFELANQYLMPMIGGAPSTMGRYLSYDQAQDLSGYTPMQPGFGNAEYEDRYTDPVLAA